MKAVPAAPAATDHEDDAEHREDALCRACARARTTVVPALGAALDHPLAQLLTGLLTVFALFGDDVRILAFDGASNADYIFSVTNAVVMTYLRSRSSRIVPCTMKTTFSACITSLFCARASTS